MLSRIGLVYSTRAEDTEAEKETDKSMKKAWEALHEPTFRVDEADLKFATDHMAKCVADFNKQYEREWEHLGNTTLSTWNPSIQHACNNVLDATLAYKNIAVATARSPEKKADAYYRSMYVLFNTRGKIMRLVEQGIADARSKYYTNMFNAVISKYNVTIFELKQEVTAFDNQRKPRQKI